MCDIIASDTFRLHAGKHRVVETRGSGERRTDLGQQQCSGLQAGMAWTAGTSHPEGPPCFRFPGSFVRSAVHTQCTVAESFACTTPFANLFAAEPCACATPSTFYMKAFSVCEAIAGMMYMRYDK